MSIKRHLKAKLHRTCGGHMPQLQAAIDVMDEQAAQQLWDVLRNLESDARRDGGRDAMRQPWKHMR